MHRYGADVFLLHETLLKVTWNMEILVRKNIQHWGAPKPEDMPMEAFIVELAAKIGYSYVLTIFAHCNPNEKPIHKDL